MIEVKEENDTDDSNSPVHPAAKKQKMATMGNIAIPRCFENGYLNTKSEVATHRLFRIALHLCTSKTLPSVAVKKTEDFEMSFCPSADSDMKLTIVRFALHGISPEVVANFIMGKTREDETGHEVRDCESPRMSQ